MIIKKRLKRTYVVAKKGVKGFFKTDKICKHTTIVDCSVYRTSSPEELLNKLLENEPVRFSYSECFTRSRAIEHFDNVLIKCAINIKSKGNITTMTLVGNKNERYSLYCDTDQNVIRIKSISSKERKKYIPKPDAKIVRFTRLRKVASM